MSVSRESPCCFLPLRADTFKVNKWFSFTYGLCTIQVGVLHWFLGWVSVCGPFKSRFSVPCSFIVFLKVIPIDFQSLVFWGLIIVSLVQDLRIWVPDTELRYLWSSGKSPYFWCPSQLWHTIAGVYCLANLCYCCYPFTLCCEGSVHWIFRSLSERIIPQLVIDLLCPQRRWVQDLATPPSWTRLLRLHVYHNHHQR